MKHHSIVNRKIFVTFQREGVHCYPAAAFDPTLATGGWDDVSFLAHPHRHVFHFKVTIDVFHDDRDLEFIQVKRGLERLYDAGTLLLDHKSCEMLADELAEHLSADERFSKRDFTIEVSEDGENGAIIEYHRLSI